MTPARFAALWLPLLLSSFAAAQPQADAGLEQQRGPPTLFPAPSSRPSPDLGSEAAVARYNRTRAQLDERRRALGSKLSSADTPAERGRVLAEASEVASRGLVELVNPWIGTPWAFSGTSQVPGQGSIACGYLVSTVLQHLGLQVERARLAQQASEKIVKTLSPTARIWRFRTGSVASVLDVVRAQPERWFVVGLDIHVGLLLRLDGGEVLFCHASYLDPVRALCEPAATAAAMQSRYHVVGALFTDDLTRAWLEERPLRTAR